MAEHGQRQLFGYTPANPLNDEYAGFVQLHEHWSPDRDPDTLFEFQVRQHGGDGDDIVACPISLDGLTDLRDKIDELLIDEPTEQELRENPLLQLFAFKHLPAHLRQVSRPFGQLALNIVRTLPNNIERESALRKLREAKDCAVTTLVLK